MACRTKEHVPYACTLCLVGWQIPPRHHRYRVQQRYHNREFRITRGVYLAVTEDHDSTYFFNRRTSWPCTRPPVATPRRMFTWTSIKHGRVRGGLPRPWVIQRSWCRSPEISEREWPSDLGGVRFGAGCKLAYLLPFR